MKKWVVFLIAALGCGLWAVPAAHAGDLSALMAGSSSDDGHLLRDYFIKQGKAAYDSGDRRGAISYFSKALTVDSGNKEALAYLHKMGLSNGIYGYGATSADQVGRLSEGLVSYQQNVDALKKTVHEKDLQVSRLVKDRQEAREAAARTEAERQKLVAQGEAARKQLAASGQTIQGLEKTLEQKTDAIVRLNTDMYQMKSDLVRKLAEARESGKNIGEAQGRIDDLEKTLRDTDRKWKASRIAYEQQLIGLQREFDLYKHDAGRSLEQKNEFISRLQDALRRQMVEADYAQNQATFDRYKLTNREDRLRQQDAQVAGLKDTLAQMQKRMAALGRGSGAAPAAETEPPAGVNQMALIKRQNASIAGLKERLDEARRQIRILQRSGAAQNRAKIAALEERVDFLRRQLQEAELASLEQQRGSHVLQQRLGDTQQRLKVVEKIIGEKDDQIKQLEKQLREVLQQMENSKPLKIE